MDARTKDDLVVERGIVSGRGVAVSDEEALSILDERVQQYNAAEKDAENSAYNEIFTMPKEQRIVVDCHSPALRATVALDQEDYQRICALAKDLGWD